jgi:two-component system, NarL family, response regulator DegU
MADSRLSILIVDDSAFVRIGLQNYLEKQGFIIYEASNPAEAMQLFEHRKTDVAILDISLQIGPDGKEGLNLARNIKLKRPEVGIILLSGSPSYYQEFLEISRKYRGIAYLYKGNNFKDELLTVIDLVGKGGVWVAPEVTSYKNTSAQVSLSVSEHKKIDCVLCFFYLLSKREKEIVQLLAASDDNAAIAENLCISLNTVSSHLSRIYSKVGLGENLSKSEKRSLLTKAYLLSHNKNI